MGKQLVRRKKTRKPAPERDRDAQRIGFGDQMREFLRRNMNWFLIAGFALLLLQDIFGTHGVLAMRRTQMQAAEIRKQIDQLNEENRKLQNRVEHLKSDPATIEGIARDEMHLKRPGEYVFPIQTAPGAADSSKPVDSKKKP